MSFVKNTVPQFFAFSLGLQTCEHHYASLIPREPTVVDIDRNQHGLGLLVDDGFLSDGRVTEPRKANDLKTTNRLCLSLGRSIFVREEKNSRALRQLAG